MGLLLPTSKLIPPEQPFLIPKTIYLLNHARNINPDFSS